MPRLFQEQTIGKSIQCNCQGQCFSFRGLVNGILVNCGETRRNFGSSNLIISHCSWNNIRCVHIGNACTLEVKFPNKCMNLVFFLTDFHHFPFSNNVGAICGAISGALMSGWISFGTQAAIASGAIQPHRLNMSIEGCDAFQNATITAPVEHDESGVFPLYRLSFMWINPSKQTILIVSRILMEHFK